ncbi:MAG TPA: FtsX-like permease family protein [Cyclobacteriaceae bacterium]|nr:FtsX-like permease family protein [Cyclobacteriaceae bacterium]
MKNNNNSLPPLAALRFLRWFLRDDLAEEVQGDLEEKFYMTVKRKSLLRARLNYWFQVLNYLRPFAIKSTKSTYSIMNSTDMFRHYISVSIRNVKRRQLYSMINVLGLTMGFACCLFIYQYVSFEYSFDGHHKNSPYIYRVVETLNQPNSGQSVEAATGWALGPAAKQEVPGVIQFARLMPEDNSAFISVPEKPDKAFEEERVFYADPAFFSIFTFDIISGDSKNPLAPGTMMISKSSAQKYFDLSDPLGQVLDVSGWINGSYRVSGIFKDVPENSHLQFDILLPMEDLLRKSQFSDPSTGWGWTNFITYFQLHKDADTEEAESLITNILIKNRRDYFERSNTTAYEDLQPLRDIHLNGNIPAPATKMGSYLSVYFFMLIGFIILLLACINYINLTTARMLDRTREVGIRKVSGAGKNQLVFQFLTESAFTIFISFALAVFISSTLRPYVNTLLGLELPTIWSDPVFWSGFLITFGITTLLTGIYPARILSSFKPVTALKGVVKNSGDRSSFRQLLVVVQFSVSVILLAGTIIVYGQLDFMRNLDLGLNLEQIIQIPGPRIFKEGTDKFSQPEVLKNELKNIPGVIQSAVSTSVPGKELTATSTSIRKMTVDPSQNIHGAVIWIDSSFTNIYGLEYMAGTGNIRITDSDDDLWPVIVNESAVKALGFTSPGDALNQEIYMYGNKAEIVAVIKDFNWFSAHEERENIFLILGLSSTQSTISVKVQSNGLPGTIKRINDLYKHLYPGNPFRYTFADKTFDLQYRNDRQFAKLFGFFATLAIFIACLGLFGLATYSTQHRIKEIGVRKVLGATAGNLVSLLSTDFLKPVVISIFIAVPVSWFIMGWWLEDFAYRIELEWWYFAGAGSIALVIAWFTVGFQAFKAAGVNPVECLKDE